MWLKAWMKKSGLHTEACAELALIFLENLTAVKEFCMKYILHHECSTESPWTVCSLHIKILACKNRSACSICAEKIFSLMSVN